MEAVAQALGVKAVTITWTEAEKNAAKIIPKPTVKLTGSGYREYRTFISEVPQAEKDKYPYGRRDIASTSEMQSLINGKRSVLDIKNTLDVQYQRKSKLESIMNYLQILRLAGLIEI